MRGKSATCLLCQYKAQPRALNPLSRWSSSNSPARDPSRAAFDINDLVLELDAVDSKYVRRYEDIMEENERIQQNHPPKISIEKNPPSTHKVESNDGTSGLYIATDADYLTLALLGDPHALQLRLNYGLRKVLKAQSIGRSTLSHTPSDFKLVVETLLKTSEAQRKAKNWDLTIPAIAEEKLCLYENIEHLKIITSRIAESETGSRFLATHGSAIVKAIRKCRQAPLTNENPDFPRPGQILKYINNTKAVLASKGFDIDAALCEAGLYYAAKAEVFPAMEYYIQYALVRQYKLGERTLKAFNHILKRIRMPSKAGVLTGRAPQEKNKGNVLRILTGWESAGIPDDFETRRPSFARLMEVNGHMYADYIRALGHAGASEALWYEWEHPDLTKVPDEMTKNERTEVFVTAFLIAKDTWKALKIAQLMDKKIKTVDHSVGPASQDDIETSERLQRLREAILVHHHRYGMDGLEGYDLEDELKLLDVNYPWNVIPYLERSLNVEWVETDDGNGFHIPREEVNQSV